MNKHQASNEETTIIELLKSVDSPFASTEITVQRIYSTARTPVVSFIIPVHNQGSIIANNLTSIQNCATTMHEFIIVNDASADNSAEEILSWIRTTSSSATLITGITYVQTSTDVFETVCDSLGIELAIGEYIIEIQSDMKISDPGFDRWMMRALQENDDVFAISGRGIHQINAVTNAGRSRSAILLQKIRSGVLRLISMCRRSARYSPSPWLFKLFGEAGRLGEQIDKPLATNSRNNFLYVGGTVMRGPLAFRKEEFVALQGFDLTRFFLGNDDHDLLARAAGTFGKTGAYLPMAFDSPTDLGSTRQVRSEANERRYRELKRIFAARQIDSYLEVSGSGMPLPHRELRKLSNDSE